MDVQEASAALSGKRVLVTGATGFVGSHLTRRLLDIGAKVVLLVRETGDKKLIAEFSQRGAEIVTGDITNRESVFKAAEGVEYIFHIAALFRQAKFPDEVYFQVNVDGAKNVFEAAEKYKVKRILHCSTIGVLGDIKKPPANETYPYGPMDVYQVSKMEGEKLFLNKCKAGEINGVCIRPGMIWGEGDRRILKLFKAVAHGKPSILGTGKTWTHWIYVTDLVNGFILASQVQGIEGEVFLIVGDTPVVLERLVNLIAKEAGVKPFPFKLPIWPVWLLGLLCEMICIPLRIEPPIFRRRVDFFAKSRWFDTSKAKEKLGFKSGQSLEQEVHNIYSWYKQNGWL